MCVSFAAVWKVAEINIDPLLGRQAPFTEVSNPTQLTAPQISTVQLIVQDKNRGTFEIRTDAHLERIRQMRRCIGMLTTERMDQDPGRWARETDIGTWYG